MSYFFALELSDSIREKLQTFAHDWQRALTGHTNVRWYNPQDYHITLKYVGSTSNVYQLAEAAQHVAKLQPQFNLNVGGCGGFPDLVAPRVLWAGVELSEPLTILAGQLDRVMADQDIVQETRPYTPHVTLGRCRANQQSAVKLNKAINVEPMFGSMRVTKFVLMQTKPLESCANRAELRYNIVQVFPFLTEMDLQSEA